MFYPVSGTGADPTFSLPGTGREMMEEALDAASPIEARSLLWWPLELVPYLQRRQREDETWEVRRRFNLGGGRKVPVSQANGVRTKVHLSVKMRMEAGAGYRPKATNFTDIIQTGRVLWVD